MAAIQESPSIFIFSHDSIFVGEDGPTHQPVEVNSFLRSIPGLQVLRPADATEVTAAWKKALQETTRPTCILLSRSALPQLDHAQRDGDPEDGAYAILRSESPELVMLGSGSETHLLLEAVQLLPDIRVSVVSVPDLERLCRMSPHRTEELMPEKAARLVVEAGHPMSWYRVIRPTDGVVAVTQFGASASGADIAEHYGFTPEAVAEAARATLRSNKFLNSARANLV